MMEFEATRAPNAPIYNCSGGGAKQFVIVTSWHTSVAIVLGCALIAAAVFFG